MEFASELTHKTADGVEVARFRTVANAADLLWSTRLGAWYVWGRVLGKGRGKVGADQRRIAADLRDLGLIPSRATRQHQQIPAAGEQHGLFCDLFSGEVNWADEMRNLRTGEGLSDSAKAQCSTHGAGFRSKKLNHGFADRDDGDPGFEAVEGRAE